MNIIIVGCGKVGFTLVEQLGVENHNITVIDTNEESGKSVQWLAAFFLLFCTKRVVDK